jgi:hypothetical protein
MDAAKNKATDTLAEKARTRLLCRVGDRHQAQELGLMLGLIAENPGSDTQKFIKVSPFTESWESIPAEAE